MTAPPRLADFAGPDADAWLDAMAAWSRSLHARSHPGHALFCSWCGRCRDCNPAHTETGCPSAPAAAR